MVAGDWSGTRAAAADAVDIGERFGDPDLVALGLIDLGRALIEEGLVAEGLAKLDEAMVAATGGGAVARRDGVRLLQRDRGLPDDVRAGAGPRVDPSR